MSRPKHQRHASFLVSLTLVVSAVALLISPQGCTGCAPIVGVDCASGFVECANACVDPTSDFNNCGGCGIACDEGQRCLAGKCSTEGASGSGSGDGSVDPPVEPPGCGLGQLECPPGSGICVNIRTNEQNCGACGVACDRSGCGTGAGTCQACAIEETPPLGEIAAPVCINISECLTPRTVCGGACTTLQDDEQNCGACGRRCESGICEAGECLGDVPQSLVLIGHDFEARPNGSMRTLLGNAVFQNHSTSSKLAVVAYTEHADLDDQVRHVNSALTAYARNRGFSWGNPATGGNGDPYTGFLDYELSSILRDFDVLLIYSQPNATDEQLEALAATWSRAMSDFVERGKVVVVLDGATEDNVGTHRIVAETGLISFDFANPPTKVAVSAGVKARVALPNDRLVGSVVSPYEAPPNTFSFVTPTANAVVVDERSLRPIVVHVSRLP